MRTPATLLVALATPLVTDVVANPGTTEDGAAVDAMVVTGERSVNSENIAVFCERPGIASYRATSYSHN